MSVYTPDSGSTYAYFTATDSPYCKPMLLIIWSCLTAHMELSMRYTTSD